MYRPFTVRYPRDITVCSLKYYFIKHQTRLLKRRLLKRWHSRLCWQNLTRRSCLSTCDRNTGCALREQVRDLTRITIRKSTNVFDGSSTTRERQRKQSHHSYHVYSYYIANTIISYTRKYLIKYDRKFFLH